MAMDLITTNTSSGAASSSFTSSIDSTYKLYIFKFYDVNPATDAASFTFQVNATDDPGGDYDVSLITSTYFDIYHSEADGTPALEYRTAHDLAQAASFQPLTISLGNGADESAAGELHLFNPSSTTYVKHFYGATHYYQGADTAYSAYVGGYINDTTAIDDIQFKMASGNFDGTIKMYGVG
jgi:hypothetical protein